MTRYDVISADSHVIEAADLWLNYIDPRFRDRAPRVLQQKDTDVFYCEGVSLLPIGGASGAGKRPEEHRREGRYERDVRRGGWDPHERLKDMKADGVDAEVLYPTFAMRMFGLEDVAFQLACFQAYNNWVKDYSYAHPERLKGIGLVPLLDLETGIGELKRIKEIGLAGAMIAIYPTEDRQYSSPTYDPFWAAVQDLDLPVSLHILTEGKAPKPSSWAESATASGLIQRSLANMIFGGVFHRFPKLKVISAENDAGWAAYFMERIDYLFYGRRGFWKHEIPLDTLPSEYFHRNVYLTFMRDRSLVPVREEIGVDKLMWPSDYPHSDSTWPNSQEVIQRLFSNVPADQRRKIVAENAARLYGFN